MSKFRSLIAACGCIAAMTLTGSAQDNWRGMRTDHFYLVGDASERAMRRVAERLEEFRAAFFAVRPTVVVFDSDRDFRPFKPLAPDGGPANVGGLFLGSNYDVYIALTGEDEAERAIYHEYTHRVSSEAGGWPLWLREGIAEFYSTVEVRDGGRTVRIGSPIGQHLAFMRDTVPIPLERFLEIEPGSSYYTEGLDQARFYAQSWALTHYLLLKRPEGSTQLSEFLSLRAAGSGLTESFTEAFGTDFETLYRELDLYIDNSLTIPAVDYGLPERLEGAGRWDAEDIAEAEARYHLGELLSRVDRFDEARTYLEESLALDPDNADPLTRLGVMAEIEGDREAALDYLSRAANTSGAGYLPRLLWAQRALSAGGWDDPETRATVTPQLREVVTLRPDNVEARQWLADVLLREPGGVDEALGLLDEGVRIAPGNRELAVVYLQALWMSGETERARSTLSSILGSITDQYTRQRAEALLADINRIGDFSRTRDRAARVPPEPAAIPAPPPPAPDPLPDAGRPNLSRTDAPSRPPSEPAGNELPLREAIPPGMASVEGRLTQLECTANGVRIHLDHNGESIRFGAVSPTELEFVSYTATVEDSIACGEIGEDLTVRVIYAEDGDSPPRPSVVELLAD